MATKPKIPEQEPKVDLKVLDQAIKKVLDIQAETQAQGREEDQRGNLHAKGMPVSRLASRFQYSACWLSLSQFLGDADSTIPL